MNWQDYFYYCEASPSGLCWAVDIFNSLRRATKIRKGMWAGSYSLVNNRFVVELDGVAYQCHRVIYELVNNTIIPEGYVVDHIDGDSSNNVKENLRVIIAAQNARNVKLNTLNSSGKSGVGWWQCGRNFYARARWNDSTGTLRQKAYNVAVYGKAEAFRLASIYRDTRIAALNAEGAGYTERHGT